jgi:hypothetical protein
MHRLCVAAAASGAELDGIPLEVPHPSLVGGFSTVALPGAHDSKKRSEYRKKEK